MGKSFKRSRFGDDDYSSKSDRLKSRRDQKKKKQTSRFEDNNDVGYTQDNRRGVYDLESE